VEKYHILLFAVDDPLEVNILLQYRHNSINFSCYPTISSQSWWSH